MGAQRTPGTIGLWGDWQASEHGPWLHGAATPPMPSGPASDALMLVPVVGLTTPDHDDLLGGSVGGQADEATIPDRFRYIEVQGQVVKVRCNPQWVVKARALAEAKEISAADSSAFIKFLSKKAARMEILDTLLPFFRAKGQEDLANSLEDEGERWNEFDWS